MGIARFLRFPGYVCFVLFVVVQGTSARTITVDAAGGGEYTSIQAAIEAAVDGDEIAVGPGTYMGQVDFAGKAVRLYSSGGAEVTTIAGAEVAPYTEDFDDGNYDGWQIVDEGNWETPSAWSAASGEMVQSSNIYTEPTSDERYLGTYALSPVIPWEAFELSLTMKADDDDWMGVMFYYKDANNYYRFAWSRQLNQRRLVKCEDGVFTTLDSDAAAYVTGQTYDIMISVNVWGTIRVYVDGTRVLDYWEGTPRAGRIGLYCWGNEGTHFDNITVSPDWEALSVVQCVSGEGPGTVLEGFTVTSPSPWEEAGGCAYGMYNAASGPTVRDCVFDGFFSGIKNVESNAAITGCTFRNVDAEVGGGVYNVGGSPTVSECIFEDNSPDDMRNEGGSPLITDCTFTNGIENNDTSAVIKDCAFYGERMINYGSPGATIINCTFQGGGMQNSYGNTATVINCVFSLCSYGAMSNYQSNPTVTNCTFVRNTPYSYYGVGGGMLNRYSNPVVTNCIFRENGPGCIHDRNESVSTVTYSNVEGGWPGEGNMDEDPFFVDADGGDFRLLWYSPCVDAASNAAVAGIGTDMDGNPRVVDGQGDGAAVVDMGAYEVSPVSESFGTVLQVTIMPQEAVDAGARWRLAGEVDWRASGEVVSDLAPGYYEVEFRELDAWLEPVSTWVCVMRDLPATRAAEYRPAGVYAIGQIPPGEVRHGGTLAFYVYSEALGAGAVLNASAQPLPAGAMTFDAATGLFVYRPDGADVLPFEVTFSATLGDEPEEQTIEGGPIANLPAEYAIVSTPMQDMPDDESRDYLFVNEVLSEADETLNGTAKKVRSITVAGKTVVFAPGHASGLYESYSSVEGGPYVADIKEMTIYAETLVIVGPLLLPQTDLTVYARRLVLEGADTYISTKPYDGRTVAPGQVLAGLNAGNVLLRIASFSCQPPGGWRFRVGGTPGHNGGAIGSPGAMTWTLDASKPLAWLSPYAVKMVLAHARDAYLYGYTAEAGEILGEYRELLETYMGLETWDSVEGTWQLEFEQMYGEVVTLLHRLESGLDYFGNLPGWTPMLSFEISKAFYEQEINRAVRVMYLSYWVQNKATTIAEKSAALRRSREAVWGQTQDFANQYTQVQALIPKLKSDAARIAAQIGRADSGGCSGLLCQLKQKEEELIARADKIVQKRHEVPWWKKMLKGLSGIVTSTISGAASGGKAGAAAGFATGSITALTDTFLAEKDPWPAINNRTGVAKTFYEIDFEAAAGEWLDNFDDIPDDLNAVEQNGAAGYLQGLRAQAASMAGGMHQIKEALKETSLSNEEVAVELKKLKAADARFNSLVDQVTQLSVEKEVFNRQLTAAIQKVSTLSNAITNNLLAIDGMNRNVSHLNRVMDPRATMYVKDMEQRATERLRKYHYYLAKSYEYRLLKPSPMDLNIGNMFAAMQGIVSADGTLDESDFGALKTVYEEQLWDLTDQIYRDYQDNRSYEATAPVRLELTAGQIAALNAGEKLVINLKEAARFQYNEENMRIIDVEVDSLEFHVEGTYDWLDYFDFEIEHAGVSKLQKDGEVYQFVHYKDVAQETNPINWNERHFADGYWQPVDRSDASESMLYSLLENCPHAGTGDIMLYARPGAWADIVLKKTPHEENSGQLVIDSVRLLVRYDRILRPAYYSTLQIGTQPAAILPYVKVDRVDRLGRQDGLGEFYRTYNTGTAVGITAPAQSGNYTFVKWTDGAGNQVSQDAAMSVALDTNRKRIAQYVYTGPLPGVGDFNEDFIVDYADYAALADVWHTQAGDAGWDAAYDISDPADEVIDACDLLRLAQEWLMMP